MSTAELRREIEVEGVERVRPAFERLRRAFEADPHPSARDREDRLDRLLLAVQRSRDELAQAIAQDFGGRNQVETHAVDILFTVEAIRDGRKNLRQWMARRPFPAAWYMQPAKAYVEPQPLGVVAVIAPWNYPVLLALAPLAAAFAAGNRALVKPSEYTPRTSALIDRMLRDAFTPDEVTVVTGGPDVARAVAELPLNHLFFTGSTTVGRLVALAAAKNLVPVTLELGGKSPAIVHSGYDLALFAERVAIGKLFNSGQTCIAPDYVLLPEGKEDAFAEAFVAAVKRAVPDERAAGEHTQVASERGFARLRGLLDEAKARGARLVESLPELKTPAARWMAPVLVFGATEQMRISQEEIFGPILPVVTYRSLDDAIAHVNRGPRPLALYYFDHDQGRIREVLRRTCSGGACINDVMMHFAQESLPFGGVGESGAGRYKGQAGFDTFSNLKGVCEQHPLNLTPRLLRPPYAPAAMKIVQFLIGGRARKPGSL